MICAGKYLELMVVSLPAAAAAFRFWVDLGGEKEVLGSSFLSCGVGEREWDLRLNNVPSLSFADPSTSTFSVLGATLQERGREREGEEGGGEEMDRLSSTRVLPGRSDDITQLGMVWEQVKAPVIVPLLRIAVFLCLTMSVMLFVEKVYMATVILAVKLLRRRPGTRYKWEPMEDDVERGSAAYPMVLVQIPMFNEKEVARPDPINHLVPQRAVYQLSIGAACGLSWPSDRLIIQVLDDSTDPAIKEMVQIECRRWASKGVNIRYEIRDNRVGYKAGALKMGMKHRYVKDCDYVVIFDADFQPDPDFLCRTIPFLIHNPQIGLVQGRWRFVFLSPGCKFTVVNTVLLRSKRAITASPREEEATYIFLLFLIAKKTEGRGGERPLCVNDVLNADECLMTRMQEMSLDYHFAIEQEVGSSTYAFFGFNGKWWWRSPRTRSVVPFALGKGPRNTHNFSIDSDWCCDVSLTMQKVSLWTKVYVIYSFFFIRKIVGHIVTFIFYCLVIPATVFVPEVEIPMWGLVYLPSAITMLNSVGTPRYAVCHCLLSIES
ncbi:hypothetical protein BHE74_00050501 [Ensete ventricosum]|nr:hypothetical protein BHE74_00050501 [Ensete ventricosum]